MAKLPVELTLKRANALAQKGQIAEAKRHYQSVLEAFPENKRAKLGLLGLSAKPMSGSDRVFLNNSIKNIQGLFAKKQFGKAVDHASLILKQFPDAFLVLNLQGLALMQMGKLDDAKNAFAKSTSVNPNFPYGYNNLGNILLKTGKPQEASEAFRKALSIKPDFPEGLYNLGNALQELGKRDEAIKAYNKVISIRPDLPEVYNDLGTVLCDLKKFQQAIEAFQKAIAVRPDFFVAHNNLGQALFEQGDFAKAIHACNKALTLEPNYASAYGNLGVIFETLGQLEEAETAYRKALELEPDFAKAHRGISRIIKYDVQDPQIGVVQDLLQDPEQSKDDKCLLHFTLAKMFEDTGKLKEAINQYKAGGRLRQELLGYTFEKDQKQFAGIETSAAIIKQCALSPEVRSAKITPVFILGMPRSGTSLIEQIVSCHSKVHGAGELELVAQLGQRFSYGELVPTLDDLNDFRQAYLAELDKLSDGMPFVTDKMPNNFKHIGLICAALPEAKIIHVKRDAAATCWSNFKNLFAGTAFGYCYDLETTVRYYKLYENLMSVWQDLHGDRIFDFDYDILTLDQETETRKLIDHLSLDWEEACLFPHDNKRVVRTVSNQQVREKVYQGSSDAWRKFEPFLDGAFDALSCKV